MKIDIHQTETQQVINLKNKNSNYLWEIFIQKIY